MQPKAIAEAEERAEKLFLSLLTPEQRATWEEQGYIKIYHLGHAYPSHYYNVLYRDMSRETNSSLCWHLPYTVPLYDDLVFKLLAYRSGRAVEIRQSMYHISRDSLFYNEPTGPFRR